MTTTNRPEYLLTNPASMRAFAALTDDADFLISTAKDAAKLAERYEADLRAFKPFDPVHTKALKMAAKIRRSERILLAAAAKKADRS